VTTPMVIAETAYLLDRQLGPRVEAALFASITSGGLRVENLGHDDWVRVGDLVTTYADLRLGGTDASVVAVAERLGVTRVATLNRRHFSVVRLRHAEAFEVLPSL
jgi:predicted nucleic acid-binding protein